LTTAAAFPGGQPFGCGAAAGFEAAAAGAGATGFGTGGGAGGGATTLAAGGGGCGGATGLTIAAGGGDGGGAAGFANAGGAWGGADRAVGTCGGGFATLGDDGVIGFGGVDDAGSFAVGICAGGCALLRTGADGVAGLVAVDGGAGDSFAAGARNGVPGFAPWPAGGIGNAWPPLGAVGADVPGVTAAEGVVGATGFVAGTWGDGVPGFAAPVGEDAPVPGAIAADGAAGTAGRGCPLSPGSGCPG
jgi:hypothetical protein